MSKGKQWWPMQADLNEGKKAIIEFQQRLRDRQWLKRYEGSELLHIYSIDGVFPFENLPDINEYMQISTHDSVIKNQARAVISRLLSMLLKWMCGLRVKAKLMSLPVVFTIPNLEKNGFDYGIIAVIDAENDKPSSKPITLVVSQQELNNKNIRGKYWKMVQSADSYKWLTIKNWIEQKKKPSFGKWVYGSFTEKREWIENIVNEASKVISPEEIDFSDLNKNLEENGLIHYSFDWSELNGEEKAKEKSKTDLLKDLGAFYIQPTKTWVLPEYWDKFAIDELLGLTNFTSKNTK